MLKLQCQDSGLRNALPPICSGFLSELGPFYPTSDGELEAFQLVQISNSLYRSDMRMSCDLGPATLMQPGGAEFPTACHVFKSLEGTLVSA